MDRHDAFDEGHGVFREELAAAMDPERRQQPMQRLFQFDAVLDMPGIQFLELHLRVLDHSESLRLESGRSPTESWRSIGKGQ